MVYTICSLMASSAAGDSPKDKTVAADLERMRQEMEAMKIIIKKQIQKLRAAKAGLQLRKGVFVSEAGQELRANETKPDSARALAGVMANWAFYNVQSMLDSEYEAAVGALLEVWSHVLFEVEKEEVQLQLGGAHEQQNPSRPGPSETKPADKPKPGKVAPQHVQDKRRERVKDRFTNMGTPDETYESKGVKVLKTGKPPRYPSGVCRVKHWWFQCPLKATEWKGAPGGWGRRGGGYGGAPQVDRVLAPESVLSTSSSDCGDKTLFTAGRRSFCWDGRIRVRGRRSATLDGWSRWSAGFCTT